MTKKSNHSKMNALVAALLLLQDAEIVPPWWTISDLLHALQAAA